MRFLRQNFVTDIAAVVPSLLCSLGANNGAGFVSSPQQSAISEPSSESGETDDLSGISRFR